MKWLLRPQRPYRWELRIPGEKAVLAWVTHDMEGWFWKSEVSSDGGEAKSFGEARKLARAAVIALAKRIVESGK